MGMLPQLNRVTARTQQQIVAFRGLNWSDQTQEGELREGTNLSARRFPCLAVRRGRAKQTAYDGCTALTARGKLVAVKGTQLLYDGKAVGTVTEGEKQFAVVNTKMVIWPDKVYLDLNSNTVKSLGAKISGTGGTFTAEKLTVSGWGDLTEQFKAGDAVTISGCTAQTKNNKDIIIKAVTATEITVAKNTLAEGAETGTLTLERRVPDLDFICESENRLWGCSSEKQTIYASSLGDPTNFYVYAGLSTDSYALAVGTEGEFTGCCKQTSSVLFWKETKLHKLLGGYPAEYSLYTYDMEGLRKGCHKSLVVINEVLYYMGLHGVYAYSGGVPTLISAAFGEKEFSDGVAGTDGSRYFLAVKESGAAHLLVYETDKNLWLREDGTRAVDFARLGRDLYFLDGTGDVWLTDSGQEDEGLAWSAQLVPFYASIQGRKYFSQIVMRLELPRAAWMKVEVRYDGGPWRETGKIIGRAADSIPVRLPVNRCDRLDIRLSGKGPCVVRAMLLEYGMGSER